MKNKIEFFTKKEDAFKRAAELTKRYIVFEATHFRKGNKGVFAVMEQEYFLTNMRKEGNIFHQIREHEFRWEKNKNQ